MLQVCFLYLIVYNFTRFRCAENCPPQDHLRCVVVCYRSRTPQKTRPGDQHTIWTDRATTFEIHTPTGSFYNKHSAEGVAISSGLAKWLFHMISLHPL